MVHAQQNIFGAHEAMVGPRVGGSGGECGGSRDVSEGLAGGCLVCLRAWGRTYHAGMVGGRVRGRHEAAWLHGQRWGPRGDAQRHRALGAARRVGVSAHDATVGVEVATGPCGG